MSHKGFSHIGLSTLDLDKTREFYQGVLGFKPVVADTIKIKEGGASGTSFSIQGATS
jgi:catechol 2,3-dioxygenase-like lactoylglutathione lyase family enzyme